MKNTIDILVKRYTAFENMSEMVNAKGGYRPSLRTESEEDKQMRFELQLIADCYDLIQEAKGDTRRAFRS